ncbi:MAG TPA: TIGR03808 family TAT-translocated repetitive protein [Pseudolabrys sp.]|nr:TIGR03808 family TAT-translocated repetitive protein [Pseudolabrys sp.]
MPLDPADTLSRRAAIATALAGGAALATADHASAQTRSNARRADALRPDALRPDAPDDQSRALQQAIDQAAARRVPLTLPPGSFRAAGLTLPAGAQISGTRGATRLLLSGDAPLLTAHGAQAVTLAGLAIDGMRRHSGNALLDLAGLGGLRLTDCTISHAGGVAVKLVEVEGIVSGNSIETSGDVALHALDARGLTVSGNTIRGAGNGGIHIWRSQKGHDGSIVADNRIEGILARGGGSGENGNAINVYRAANVIVRGNRIRDAAFSAVRGNAASGIQIIDNTCNAIGEVALYAEFDFEGAVIAGNVVDDAAIGIAVTNFKEGGRLAVVQGNMLRNITRRRPAGTDPNDGWGIGIGVEADTAVTGNVVDNAAVVGISVGTGTYLRDVTVNGNVVRGAPTGIAVSVAPGAGAATITGNAIAGAKAGALVGMAWDKVASTDLARDAARFPQLTIAGNRT